MSRPTVSTRPIGPLQIEVRITCRHAGRRIGYQLGPNLTAAAALCSALGTHHFLEGCSCMNELWARYRTRDAPADLDGMRMRFERLWSDVESAQQRQGYAIVDWAAAVRTVRGT